MANITEGNSRHWILNRDIRHKYYFFMPRLSHVIQSAR
ncbi:hypothetical protein C427_1134 [Paraglaciecola psychrophila 170]|uniref:Uncharacterized protein n=1 Tax=Paraglaciecola psychrophila 170 TaxID=1129794 RepID=K7ANS0_9ALTE|nr:hypothetical protein C427_1134 [Paraglaciecola psychrophila 170]GAC36975.1 hypothetical protein GPSY_1340 [Paraglaciecola psychrophila 170]